jgi:dihydrofolate reductase
VHGSGALVRWLFADRLVDELTLLVCPVVVGQGTRLFPDSGPDMALDLVDGCGLQHGPLGPGSRGRCVAGGGCSPPSSR